MKLIIRGNRKVTEIQKEFNSIFPYLNLEFFDLPENQLVNYISSGQTPPNLSVKDIREKEEDGELIIHHQMTIMQLENILSDDFGIQAKVFVKRGDQWIRASLNGYWMLYHKNEEGRRTSQPESNN
jgi:hypothetical protein